jgi:phage major head subunit gpT-like protein
MATVTTDFLQALFTQFDTGFETEFLAATRANDYKRIATVMPSNTLTESINWLGTVPRMRLWTDTRVHQAIAPSFTYNLTNQHYEATVDVDRDTIEDDTYGLIMPRVTQLGQEAGRYPWELSMNALTANGTCYDGQAFFSAAHSEQNSGTQSNLVGTTGQTVAAIMADIATALTRMRRFKDNQGRPMMLGRKGGLTLLAPPELEQQFTQVINNNIITVSVGSGVFGGQDNYLQGIADLIIDPYLTSTTTWYLLDTGGISVKPLVYLDRKPPETTDITDPMAAQVFNTRMFSWGVDFRGAVGYGWWQTAVQVS